MVISTAPAKPVEQPDPAHKPLTGTGTPTPAPRALKEADADDFWQALMAVVYPLPPIKQHEVDMLMEAFMDVAVRGTQPDFKTAMRLRFGRN